MAHGLKVKVNKEEMEEEEKNKVITRDSLKSYIVFNQRLFDFRKDFVSLSNNHLNGLSL